MSSRTVKWLLLASVLLLAFPVVAGASTARIQGMGIQSDYVKDYTTVYTYLSNACCVGNLVYGEFGNWEGDTYTNDRAVGVFVGNLFDGKYGTLGLRLSEETAQLGQGDANTPVGAGYDGWDPNSNTEHAFDVIWGKKFGKMSLGLRLNKSYGYLEGDPLIFGGGYYGIYNNIKGDVWNTYGPTDLNYHRNIMGYGGGIGYEMSDKFNLEGSFLYQSRTFLASDTLYDKNLEGGSKYENDGSGAYLFALRGMWQQQPSVLVVPVFKYYSIKSDASADYLYTNDADELTHFKYDPIKDEISGWQVGVAGNWTINQNDLFVLGLTFAQNTEKYQQYDATSDEGGNLTSYMYSDYKYTESMMPTLFAALETHVNSWLTLRFGAQQGVFYTWKEDAKNYYSDGTRYYSNVTTEHYSPFEMMLGAGFKFGNLQLDATLNPDFVHNGPYFISGQTTGYDAYDYDGSALFPKVTATYSF